MKPLAVKIFDISFQGYSLLTLSRRGSPARSAYKFLHQKDLHFWTCEKSVRLGTLNSYSKTESRGGVADPMEIQIRGISTSINDVRCSEDQLIVENLSALGLADLKIGRFMNFNNMSVKRQNRFIFCLSERFDLRLFRRWNAVEGYDRVIKIHDVNDFSDALLAADHAGQNRLGGGVNCKLVEYVDFPIDLSIVDMRRFKFIKDRSVFAWQKEMRMSWPSILSDDETPYDLHVPDLHQHIEVIPITLS